MVYRVPGDHCYWAACCQVRYCTRRVEHVFNPAVFLHRPQYVVFPNDENGFAIDDQFYVGNSGLLVKPVTAPGVTETSVYLAEDQVRRPPRPFAGRK